MKNLSKSLYIVGISTITSNDVAHKEIGQLWADFFATPIKEKLSNVVSPNVFAVYSDYENGDKGKYKITIGYAVSDINKIHQGLTAVTIPARSYKVYKANSRNPEDIVAAWKIIWNTDPKLFPRSFVADFEEYSDNEVTVNIGYNN